MKATREQVLAMAGEAGLRRRPGGGHFAASSPEEVEALVHAAQQFTLDQLRSQKPDFAILDGESKTHLLHNIPETLE